MGEKMLVLLLVGALGVILPDLVAEVPFLPDTPNFKTYSGYLDIPNSKGKSLHYVLVESQNNPRTDPLVLWLNGGPGCSSLDGYIYQHGPYVFSDFGTTLFKNQYSWNTNASVIYLESPAGVGFSVLGDISNNITDDQITAHDNLQALLQFFQGYPEYREHDFYITGESYAGIYVPTLAHNILMHNMNTPYNNINLKGIAVGNGCTDWTVDCDPAFIKWAWSHSLFNYEWYNKINEDCQGFKVWTSKECQEDIQNIYNIIMPGINIYDLYGTCVHQDEYFEDNQLRLKFLKDRLGGDDIPPCCAWKGAYEYFRNKTVVEAFHIRQDADEWKFCVDLDYRSDYLHGSFYTYPDLIRAGLRVWVYSGDVDGSVPFTGTREWINKLNLNTVKDYRQWYVDGQVAGYYQEYQGLTFLTVKGAGHMVPQWKRPQAHYFFNKFISGGSL